MPVDESVQGYKGPQVTKLVGITYRQLDHWDRTGLLSPSLAAAHGSGTQRLYSYADVVALRLIKKLLDSGVTLQRARKALDYFRTLVGDDLSSATLLVGASHSVLARTDGELLDLVKGGQQVFNVVPLGGLLSDVDAAVHELRERAAGATGEAAQEEVAAEAR